MIGILCQQKQNRDARTKSDKYIYHSEEKKSVNRVYFRDLEKKIEGLNDIILLGEHQPFDERQKDFTK